MTLRRIKTVDLGARRGRKIDPDLPGHPARLELARRGISQRSVARYLGMADQNLNSMLCKRIRVSERVRVGLSEFLSLPPEELFDDEGER